MEPQITRLIEGLKILRSYDIDIESYTLDDMDLDEDDWTEMTEEEQEQAIDDHAMELLFNRYVSYCAEEIEA